METVEAAFVESINPVASLGFIGLATDRASLVDFNDFVSPFDGVAVHSTRIPFAPEATPENLAAMRDHLVDGTRQLVPGQPLGSISFSCTSGTVAIGGDVVDREVSGVRPDVPVVTPIGAAITGLRGLGCSRISVLMPYLQVTAEMVADHFVVEGFTIDRSVTFDLAGDPEMNRVDPARIRDVALEICDDRSDGLFISCTGWRTHGVVQQIEDALGKPVVTSNQALAWQALRAAGVNEQGRLFSDL